jgi:hypothetical protein
MAKQLGEKDHSQTTEYALLYGKIEVIIQQLGLALAKLLTTADFAFSPQYEGQVHRAPYEQQYYQFFNDVLEEFVKVRQIVGTLVQKNLRKFTAIKPSPETEFEFFARNCVQYVLEICHNEVELANTIFLKGPLVKDYVPLGSMTTYGSYADKLDSNIKSLVTILFKFLEPYLSKGKLHQICDLLSWVDTMYMSSEVDDDNNDRSNEDLRRFAQFLLTEHLWPLADASFNRAIADLEHFRPSAGDLTTSAIGTDLTRVDEDEKPNGGSNLGTNANNLTDHRAHTLLGPGLANAYPTVKIAVNLLVMYKDCMGQERLKRGDVVYDIVHKTTESLQRAATTIKRESLTVNAQVFLIKNLLLIKNLIITHEITDTTRQAAELDFSTVWMSIREIQQRGQLLNPAAYYTHLSQGRLLPRVIDKIMNASDELDKVLRQQITAFTEHWRSKVNDKKKENISKATRELDDMLIRYFADTRTRNALWDVIRGDPQA